MENLQIIHFNMVFHYFHHPFWGTTIFGNIQIWIPGGFEYRTCHWKLIAWSFWTSRGTGRWVVLGKPHGWWGEPPVEVGRFIPWFRCCLPTFCLFSYGKLVWYIIYHIYTMYTSWVGRLGMGFSTEATGINRCLDSCSTSQARGKQEGEERKEGKKESTKGG